MDSVPEGSGVQRRNLNTRLKSGKSGRRSSELSTRNNSGSNNSAQSGKAREVRAAGRPRARGKARARRVAKAMAAALRAAQEAAKVKRVLVATASSRAT